MSTREGDLQALALLRGGRSDEQVERLTAMPLLRIIELRAMLASAPADVERAS